MKYGDLEYHPKSRILSLANLEQSKKLKILLGQKVRSEVIEICGDDYSGSGLCFDYDGTTKTRLKDVFLNTKIPKHCKRYPNILLRLSRDF